MGAGAQDGRGRFRKVSRQVAFDFHLDLQPYAAAAAAAAPARYQLAGVVEHAGTSLRSGATPLLPQP